MGILTVDVVRTRAVARAAERRSAAAETAQDLLARIRRGADAGLPAGWTIERREQAGAIVVTVHGEGVHLSTVVPR